MSNTNDWLTFYPWLTSLLSGWNPVKSSQMRVSVCLPCFLAVRVMVSLKVLQLELSPPQTPHLSSCFEEPTTPSQPTFCSQRHEKFTTGISAGLLQLAGSHTSHSPRTPRAHTRCGGPCMSSVCHPGPPSAWRPRPVSLWTDNAGCSVL